MNPGSEAGREPEPELAAHPDLGFGPAEADDLEPAELDALFTGVRRKVEVGRSRPLAWLAEQPTVRRRLFGVLVFALIVAGTVVLAPRPDLYAFPPPLLGLVGGALGALLVLTVVIALRPLHRPALPRWVELGLCGAALILAFALALAPGLHAHVAARPPEGLAPWGHAIPCLGYGLLVGLPAYALLRFLDRGAPFDRLLSAAAAGLGANLALELHCPVGGAEHLALGHASIVLVFLVGVALFERFVAARRRRS